MSLRDIKNPALRKALVVAVVPPISLVIGALLVVSFVIAAAENAWDFLRDAGRDLRVIVGEYADDIASAWGGN